MENIWLSLLLPLSVALIITLLQSQLTYWEAFGLTVCSFLLSFIFLAFSLNDLFYVKDYKIIYPFLDLKWLDFGDFIVEISLYFDFLSAFLGLLISGIGFLIICYCAGYFNKKFLYSKRMLACMNFSLFSVLILLLAKNLILFITGLESLGLIYYLILKNHVKTDSKEIPENSFLLTQIGTLAIFFSAILSFAAFSTFDHQIIINSAITDSTVKSIMVRAVAFLLLTGALIYTGQFPFHIWLQKTAEAPIPVVLFTQISSMTIAGIYLMLRFIPIFTSSPITIFTICIAGLSSALICSIISACQRKIRRALIFDTLASVGYLFFIYSVNAYEVVLFYLSGFLLFKIPLFLCYELIIENKIMVEWQAKSRRQLSLLMLISTVFISGLYDLSWYLLQPYLIYEKATIMRLFPYMIFSVALGIFISLSLCNIFFSIFSSLNSELDVTDIVPNNEPTKKTALFFIALFITFGSFICLFPFLQPDLFRNKIFILTSVATANHQITTQAMGFLDNYLLAISAFFASIFGSSISYVFSKKSIHRKNKILAPMNVLYKFFSEGCYIYYFLNNFLYFYIKKGIWLFLWKIIDIRIIGGLVNDFGDFFNETKKIIHPRQKRTEKLARRL